MIQLNLGAPACGNISAQQTAEHSWEERGVSGSKHPDLFSLLHLFIYAVGGQLLYSAVMVFAMYQHESALGVHVFPPPEAPTRLPLDLIPPGCHRHPPWAPASCVELALVISFTCGNVRISVLFSSHATLSFFH